MQKLTDYKMQLFMYNLVDALKYENDSYERKNKQLDIPFIISSLYQSFKNEPHKFKRFFDDLNSYNYQISIEDTENDYGGIIDANIYLYNNDKNCNWHYKIKFDCDERMWGYCECTPDMPDYREDKQCCGHGCDAYFSSFSLYKVEYITNGSWDGDEHSYWEFEDEFYKDEKEIAAIKERERKEAEIKELRKRLEETTRKLKELESEMN